MSKKEIMSFKKYLEIYKINRRINHLRREISPDPAILFTGSGSNIRIDSGHRNENEKTIILRNQMNDLIAKRERMLSM